MVTPLDDENYTLEMHLRNFPQKDPIAIYWNDGVWEVNTNIDVDSEIKNRAIFKPKKSRFKATASDLKLILQERGESVIDKNNRLKIASELGVSERTIYTLWKQLKNANGGSYSE